MKLTKFALFDEQKNGILAAKSFEA